MNATDFNAVYYDGKAYCVTCLPALVLVRDEAVSPIFADAEVEHWPVCAECGHVHTYMTLLRPVLFGLPPVHHRGKRVIHMPDCPRVRREVPEAEYVSWDGTAFRSDCRPCRVCRPDTKYR